MPRPRNNEFTKDMFYFLRSDPGVGLLGTTDTSAAEQTWKLKFEAHINSIHDSSSPSWESTYDMGRADPKVFYQSTSRNISIDFTVVAMTREEHDANHVLMAKLGILTYPKYSDNNGFNGVHVYYLIGKLMSGYGVITSLDYDWNADTPWVDHRPLYTNVSLSIMKLADANGKRPNINANYFI